MFLNRFVFFRESQNRKLYVLSIFVLLSILNLFANATDAKKLTLYFFGSPTCGECLDIKQQILFPAVDKYAPNIDLHIYDVDSDSGFVLMTHMEKLYSINSSASIELFFPDTFLLGGDEIHKHGKALIEWYISHPEKWVDGRSVQKMSITQSSSEILKDKFKEFSFVSIVMAGIIDGINPCAIATMIFLISFLATRKRSRKQILTIGLCFTFSVFVTYLLLGIGAFKIITALEQYRWVSKIIRWSAILLALGVGLMSFWDAFKFGKSKKTEDIKLQLPKAVKLRIHKVISGNLSGKQLATGAIVTGFLVTLLEAVCTGQVYLPTIILMTQQSELKGIGWAYLLFYNFLFVLPLLIVMILAYYGLKWEKLAKTTQNNLVVIKILFGCVLTGLAVFLFLYM